MKNKLIAVYRENTQNQEAREAMTRAKIRDRKMKQGKTRERPLGTKKKTNAKENVIFIQERLREKDRENKSET